jgi:hypothetical protein
VAEPTTLDHPTTAGLAYQSFANSVAIAVSDATAALRNLQAISSAATAVAMSRMLAGTERNEAAQQVVEMATQLNRDAVRLWQEVQATAQALVDGREKGTSERESGKDPSPDQKPVSRKVAKKAGRKPAKPTLGKKRAARKPSKPEPAAKKAPAKRAKPAKGAAKPRKSRSPKPKPAPAPPTDVVPPSDEG